MNTIYTTHGGARRAYGVLLLALAAVVAACSYAAAGQTFTATNPGDLTGLVGYDEVNGGTANDWANTTPSQNVIININGNQTYNSTAVSGSPIWFIHGTDTPITPTIKGPNYAGFTNLTINGNNHTLSATATTLGDERPILEIINVAGDLDINNLTVTGGVLYNSNGVTNGGAGMFLGATNRYAAGTSISFANLNLNSVTISNNIIDITDTAGRASAGGGVFVDGTDYNLGATNSVSVFTGVNILNNENKMTSTDVNRNWGNAIGGGGRIKNVADFTYAGGKVIGNKAESVDGSTAFGGGLQIDSDYATTTQLTGVEFTNNSATVSTTVTDITVGAGPVSRYARGGALSVQYDPTTSSANIMTVTVDGGTTFTTNDAIATGFDTNALGGAVHLDDNVQATFTGTAGTYMFDGNTADATAATAGLGASEWGAAKGGAVSSIVRNIMRPGTSYLGSMTFDNVDFRGNQALAANNAEGGAIYTETLLKITGGSFENQLAQATDGWARGGAISSTYVDNGLGANSISGATFTDNTTEALIGGENAYGGAIYQSQGVLNVTDSQFTGNKAIANSAVKSAAGGAIFMDTSVAAVSSVLNLEGANNAAGSTAKELLIKGNTSEVSGTEKADGIYFGNADGATSLAAASLNINTNTTGIVSLLDPVTVNMNNNQNFTMTKTGTGRLNWDEANVFTTTGGTSFIDLQDGEIHFGENFTATSRGSAGLGNDVDTFQVDIADAAKLSFSATREDASVLGNKAIFDFSDAYTTNKIFTVGTGIDTVEIGTDLDREILSFNREYVIADGLTTGQADAVVDNLYGTGLITDIRRDASDKVIATASYQNVFDKYYNPNNAQNAMQQLVKQKDADGNYTYTRDQVEMIRGNARATTAELYMDHGQIFINSASRFAENAVKIGLQEPFRMLQAEPAMGRRVADRAYESRAFRSDSGFRLWAGYFGDFAEMDNHSGFNGYDADTNGFVVGMNYDFSHAASVGFYGGYSRMDAKAKEIDSKTDGDNYHFGLIGRVSPMASLPNLAFFGDVGYHFSNNDTYRRVGASSALGSFDQDYWTIGTGAEYTFSFGDLNLTPAASFRWAYLDQDGIDEGGFTRTHTDGFEKHAFYSRLGADLAYNFRLPTAVITPKLGLAWRHNFGARRFTSDSYYLDAANPIHFRTSSARNDRDSLDINLGVNAIVNLGGRTKMGVDFGYQYNVSRHTDNHTIYAGLSLGF